MAYNIPIWIFVFIGVGAIIYVYFVGGSDDPQENYSISFVTLLLGLVLGGIFLK